MNFDLPDQAFFDEIFAYLLEHLSAQNAQGVIKGLRLILTLAIMGIILAMLILLSAILFKNLPLLDVGKDLFLGAGAALFFTTSLGHWAAGRAFKVLGCWAVTTSLLAAMVATGAEMGLLSAVLGLAGIIISLFPRAKSS